MTINKTIKSSFFLAAFSMAVMGPSTTALADETHLKVSSSIMPIHLLTKQIGAGLVDAQLILPANQSVHHAQFRPSQRRLITTSDVIFAIDPKMEGPLAKVMAQEADKFVLFSEFVTASQRQDDDHDDHDDHKDHDDHDDHKDHDDHDDHKDHKDHDDHDDHKDHDDHDDHKVHDDHDDHKGHDDHDDHKVHDDHDDHAGHDHSGPDYHFWFSPHKMVEMAEVIYQDLSTRLPDHKEALKANYETVLRALDEADHDIHEALSDNGPHHFVAMHDNTLYLEQSYPMKAVGFLLMHDHGKPSAGHLRELQENVTSHKAACLFTEPQVNDKLVREIALDLNLTMVSLDPLGAALDEDDGTLSDYWSLVVSAMKDCFTS